MTLLSMTFHESYGEVPTRLLTLYRRHNVTPADHDMILDRLGYRWDSPNIEWDKVLDLVLAHCDNGVFRLPIYF